MEKKNKKKKKQYIDDGHTVYSMKNVGRPGEIPDKKENIGLTRSERRAVIKAALAHYVPMLLGVVLCFGFAMLLIYLWLS